MTPHAERELEGMLTRLIFGHTAHIDYDLLGDAPERKAWAERNQFKYVIAFDDEAEQVFVSKR